MMVTMTEIKLLPIWTLGDPHNASRHNNVTTNSSFMVVFRFLTRRQISLRQRFLPKHHLHHTLCELMASFQVRSSSADALSCLLRCACRSCCCCCWTEGARRELLRNTDEARERTEDSRQPNVKQRFYDQAVGEPAAGHMHIVRKENELSFLIWAENTFYYNT